MDYINLSKHHYFFFNDTATTEIYTLSLHDALPISARSRRRCCRPSPTPADRPTAPRAGDRKSTRLNSSHRCISYAVFCLKKKKIWKKPIIPSNSKIPRLFTKRLLNIKPLLEN